MRGMRDKGGVMGRELDALVAEKVMGFYRTSQGFYTNVPEGDFTGDEPFYWHKPPAYSTDMAAAWQVVEKWADDEYKSVEVRYGNGSAYCRFIERGYRSFQDTEWEAWSDTAPLAICLAALKVVGIEYNPVNLVSHT